MFLLCFTLMENQLAVGHTNYVSDVHVGDLIFDLLAWLGQILLLSCGCIF